MKKRIFEDKIEASDRSVNRKLDKWRIRDEER